MTGRHPWGRLSVVACVLWILPLAAAAATPAAGSETAATVALPQPLTRDAISQLVARLSDREVRALLLAQLEKTAAPAADEGAAPVAAGFAARVDRARTEIGAVLRSWRELPAALGAAVARFSEGRTPYHLLLVAGVLTVMLLLSWTAERLVGRVFADLRARLGGGAGPSSGVVRAILDVLLLVVFTVTAFAVFLVVYQGHAPSRELFLAVLLATVQVRLAILIARTLLAPQTPAQRLLPFDDAAARTLYRGVVSLVWLWGFLEVLNFFLQRFGVPREPYLLVVFLARILFAIVFLRLVWRMRGPIAAKIRGDGQSVSPPGARRPLAGLDDGLRPGPPGGLDARKLAGRLRTARAGILSLLVVLAMPLVDMALCRLLDRRAARAQPDGRGAARRQLPAGPATGRPHRGHRRRRSGHRPPVEP